jgi:hypothetical protein
MQQVLWVMGPICVSSHQIVPHVHFSRCHVTVRLPAGVDRANSTRQPCHVFRCTTKICRTVTSALIVKDIEMFVKVLNCLFRKDQEL